MFGLRASCKDRWIWWQSWNHEIDFNAGAHNSRATHRWRAKNMTQLETWWVKDLLGWDVPGQLQESSIGWNQGRTHSVLQQAQQWSSCCQPWPCLMASYPMQCLERWTSAMPFCRCLRVCRELFTINGCSHIILRCLPGQRDPCGCCLAKNSLAFCVSRTLQCFYCMWMMCFSWVMKSGSGILSFPNWKVSSRWHTPSFSRETGGGFEFLKRYHEIAPEYTSLTVHPEAKHVCTLFDRFTAANGKPLKLFKKIGLEGVARVNK